MHSRSIRLILAAALCLLTACLIVTTRHWPLVGDASLFRYIDFLIGRGLAPYRDIIDINMPGAYFVDWFAVHIFGTGNASWRIFDFSLLALAGASMIAISRKSDWLAGFTAAVVFAVLHAADGVAQTGQRDLTAAVLLLAAFALFFRWMRTLRLWPIFIAALLTGLAITIKPTAFPFAIVLAILIFVLPEKNPEGIWKHLLAAIVGFVLPLIGMLAFLVHEHALRAFLFIVRGLVPFHAALSHRSVGWLLTHSVAPLEIFLAPWLFLLIRAKSWRQRQTIALLAAIACGLISYIAQGKGYPYHRYPLIGFLLLAMSIEFIAAWQRSNLDRAIGALSLLGLIFVIAPIATWKAAHYDWRNQEFITMLESDLNHQGGRQLDGQVQCLDTIAGCINTLYRMRLVQSTGFLYDCYFFAPGQTDATEDLRNKFLDEFEQSRPEIVVLTNRFCLEGPTNFNRIENWPQFDEYFTQHYTLIAERHPPHLVKWWSKAEQPSSFRIYKRNAGNMPAQNSLVSPDPS